MLEAKDFATGCLTILLCALLLPLFYVVFKLSLFFAIVLAVAIGIILGITVVGRIVRLFITGKWPPGESGGGGERIQGCLECLTARTAFFRRGQGHEPAAATKIYLKLREVLSDCEKGGFSNASATESIFR